MRLAVVMAFTSFLLFSLPGAFVAAGGERLLPLDQSRDDPSFAAFKGRLLKAIREKDRAFIKSILSEDVMFSFGHVSGMKNAANGFLEHYQLQGGKGSEFWDDLRRSIDLGCTRSEEKFVCPYVFSRWPSEYDSFSHVAVIKERSPLRSQPSFSAKVIRSVSYEILKVDANAKASGDWFSIDLGSGKTGYLAKSDGRLAIDYRAGFEKLGGGWRLKYFIDGD